MGILKILESGKHDSNTHAAVSKHCLVCSSFIASGESHATGRVRLRKARKFLNRRGTSVWNIDLPGSYLALEEKCAKSIKSCSTLNHSSLLPMGQRKSSCSVLWELFSSFRVVLRAAGTGKQRNSGICSATPHKEWNQFS